MPNCIKHPEVYFKPNPPGNFCYICRDALVKEVKTKKKEDIAATKKVGFYNGKRISTNPERKKLKDKLQAAVRELIMPYYAKLGVDRFCWICKRPLIKVSGKGYFNPNLAHYYAKSSVYFLWADPVNTGVCDYDCNVNKPETVTDMEPMMIKVWGQDKVDDLKKRHEHYKFQIDTGQVDKFPKAEWFEGMITFVRSLRL